jgi:hypothetical protein
MWAVLGRWRMDFGFWGLSQSPGVHIPIPNSYLWCQGQDSNLRSPSGQRFYRPSVLAAHPPWRGFWGSDSGISSSGPDSRFQSPVKAPAPIPLDPSFSVELWSPRGDSNPQPTDYKSVALPLRHSGSDPCGPPKSLQPGAGAGARELHRRTVSGATKLDPRIRGSYSSIGKRLKARQ